MTIAAAEVVRLLFTTHEFQAVTSSADGLGGYQAGFRAANPFPAGRYGWGPFIFDNRVWFFLVISWIVVAIAAVFTWLIMRSPWGRVLKGIREDEDAVRALGKNVFAYKMQASCSVVSSARWAAWSTCCRGGRPVVLPDVADVLRLGDPAARRRGDVFGPIAGLGHLLGAAGVLLGLPRPCSRGRQAALHDADPGGQLRFILVGVALMLLVIFRPQGILGNKKELTFVK